MRIFFTLVVSLSLAACGQGECVAPDAIVPRQDLAPPDTELSRDYLAGSWYLDQVRADRSTVRSLATLADDGTIEIEFLIVYEDGTRLAKTEYGYWGVSGDVYFTIIREASDGRQR